MALQARILEDSASRFAAEIPPIVKKQLVAMWQVKRHEPEELEVSIIEDTVGNNCPREKKGEQERLWHPNLKFNFFVLFVLFTFFCLFFGHL